MLGKYKSPPPQFQLLLHVLINHGHYQILHPLDSVEPKMVAVLNSQKQILRNMSKIKFLSPLKTWVEVHALVHHTVTHI